MIDLALIKKHLRLDSSFDDGSEDDFLLGLAEAALKLAEEMTGTSFLSKEETLRLDGFPPGAAAIELDWTPVQNITLVEYIDASGVSQELDVETVRLDSRKRVYPVLKPPFGQSWPRTIAESESVTITAEVGFEILPATVRSAALLIIGHLYENREASTAVNVGELPMGVSMLLNHYYIPRIG
jgi:uncharacterized phiE125 gp8 family phage protein